MAKEDIQASANAHYVRANSGSHMWSTAYHTCLGIPILLGFVIALLGTDKDGVYLGLAAHTISTLLGSVSAALTALAAFGGFERKRIANRVARTALEDLKLRIPRESDEGKLIAELNEIEKALDAGAILGTSHR